MRATPIRAGFCQDTVSVGGQIRLPPSLKLRRAKEGGHYDGPAYIVAVEYCLRVGSFEVGDRQLQVAFAVPDVLLEGKREIDGGAMLGDEGLAF